KSNNEYTIEVYLYGFNKENIEKELASIDNSPFKQQWLKITLSDLEFQKIYQKEEKQSSFGNSMKEIEIDLGYGYKKEIKQLTDPNDYQIILNNPEGKPDLTELEKSVDLLVFIKDEISRERINLPPRLILRSSCIPAEEEIARLRRDFEGDDFIFAVPLGVKSIKAGSFFSSKLDELRKKSREVEDNLEKEIQKDIKENKSAKHNERMKALIEMEKK
ncbi:3812_t:CDS:2, partial [Paraglomus occultum]